MGFCFVPRRLSQNNTVTHGVRDFRENSRKNVGTSAKFSRDGRVSVSDSRSRAAPDVVVVVAADATTGHHVTATTKCRSGLAESSVLLFLRSRWPARTSLSFCCFFLFLSPRTSDCSISFTSTKSVARSETADLTLDIIHLKEMGSSKDDHRISV